MRKLRLYPCLMVALVTLWLAAPSVVLSRDGERYTLDQAVTLVKQTYGGQVLKATSTERGGRRLYKIRVLTEDGHVHTFTVDARDGLVP